MNRSSGLRSRKESIKQLHDSILAADLHYRIYWIYKNKDDREKYFDIMNSYLGFFEHSIQAHFKAFTVILYTIYERSPDTVNFGRLLAEASAELKASVDPQYVRAKAIWKKIAVLRNNHFGHMSAHLDADAVFKIADITYNEIKELIDISKELVNSLSYEEDRSKFVYTLDSAKDTYRMLEKLRS